MSSMINLKTLELKIFVRKIPIIKIFAVYGSSQISYEHERETRGQSCSHVCLENRNRVRDATSKLLGLGRGICANKFVLRPDRFSACAMFLSVYCI